MKSDPQKKLQHRQANESLEGAQSLHNEQQVTSREFASVEEMIRYDAAQTEVPATLKTRLNESISKEPKSERPASWWRRWFGG